MKRPSILLAALLLLTLALPAWAAPEKTLPDGRREVLFSVPDMECSMCTRTVSAELKRVDGVVELKLDDVTRTVTIKFDPSQTDVKRLQAAIKKAGFASKPVEQAPH
jgi:copper chaperone CopZ